MSMEGMHAWIAEVERKLGKRTRVFLALAVIAIGLGGAAIYLAIDARQSSVSEGDVQALQEELEARIDAAAAGGAAAAPTTPPAEPEAAPPPSPSQPEGSKPKSGSGKSGGGSNGASGGGVNGTSSNGSTGGAANSAKIQELLEQAQKQDQKAGSQQNAP